MMKKKTMVENSVGLMGSKKDTSRSAHGKAKDRDSAPLSPFSKIHSWPRKISLNGAIIRFLCKFLRRPCPNYSRRKSVCWKSQPQKQASTFWIWKQSTAVAVGQQPDVMKELALVVCASRWDRKHAGSVFCSRRRLCVQGANILERSQTIHGWADIFYSRISASHGAARGTRCGIDKGSDCYAHFSPFSSKLHTCLLPTCAPPWFWQWWVCCRW